MNTDWLRNLPNWIKGTIALITTIIGFIALVLSNVYLGVTVIVVFFLIALLALSIYVVFSKEESTMTGDISTVSRAIVI